jgi:mRNA interferase MazF
MITYEFKPKRGEVWYADLSPIKGSEQGGLRPCVIVQNDIGNTYSPTTIIVPLTTAVKKQLPTHRALGYTLGVKGIVLCEQIRVIDKSRLKNRLCTLSADLMAKIDETVKVALGL